MRDPSLRVEHAVITTVSALCVMLSAAAIGGPPAPPAAAPENATVLFDGADADEWRDPSGSLPVGWTVEAGALLAALGADPLVSRSAFSDYHMHLECRVDDRSGDRSGDGLDELSTGGSYAGVLLAERFEVVIADARPAAGDLPDAIDPSEPDARSVGAIDGVALPTATISHPSGPWRRIDVAYSHKVGQPARVSVWVDDVRVQQDVEVPAPTPNGISTPLPGEGADGGLFVGDRAISNRADLGTPFTISAKFQTKEGGTLIAKCPKDGAWVPNAKALFLRGGRVVYDIGWVGAITSRRIWNDGRWHHVVVTSDGDGLARMFVDGEPEGERQGFRADDHEDFVLKVGAANDNFGGVYEGTIDAVRHFDRALSADDAKALSEGHPPEAEPAFAWPGEDAVQPGSPQRARIRIRADGPIRVANVWLRPLGSIDHAAQIAGFEDSTLERGRDLYQGLCISCHGKDGGRSPNPRARAFTSAPFQNGRDPKALFDTITGGFGEMPGNAWLDPTERYALVHYLREAFLREQNPSEYFTVDDAWLNSLEKGHPRRARTDAAPLPDRDFGPALSSQLAGPFSDAGGDIGCALTVRLDDQTAIAYDLQRMQSVAAWTGGFLDLAETQHYRQRGEGRARPGGALLAGLEGFGFGHEGTLDWDRSARPPRGLLPKRWLDYHGHYVHGDAAILSYAIDGRDVLERPGVDRTAGLPLITHRMHIAAGAAPLVLSVIKTPEGPGDSSWNRGFSRSLSSGETMRVLMLGRKSSWDFAAAIAIGLGSFEMDADERAMLRVPPSGDAREVWILRAAGSTKEERDGFLALVDNLALRPMPPSPSAHLQGGPSRYLEVLLTEGTRGEDDGAYALDTLTLPEENPWNAWIRTSALDFLSDGRAVVSTYGGDVWIVSGIDGGLRELRWRRYASGMFEPMGVRVVDDQVYVTCRDRITRLHDLNQDGEADFYESFFADPDVSPNFHAFNFDLQTDPAGNFYYAKSGQYTDFSLPGAILRVSPDGEHHDVYCTGLRTPNGMGMSKDGFPLVSDNQGNWIPASKITLTQEGGFYGVFPAIQTSSPGIQTRDDFDPPVVWMPQRLDSSSGGQLYVDDPRFGPLSGRYLHTSFGKGWMYAFTIDEDTGGPAQGAIWRLPFQFAAGIQRLRVNPADGQVYAVGLSGWQGPADGEDGCLQRVRYTGEPRTLLLDVRARGDSITLTFDRPLHPSTADSSRGSTNDASGPSFSVHRWNYRWARGYGSDHYSVSAEPSSAPSRSARTYAETGEDSVAVLGATLSSDRRSLTLQLEDSRPADQLHLEGTAIAEDLSEVPIEVYLTIHGARADG